MGGISMYCSKCGKRIPDDSSLCPYCGSEVDEEIKEESTETEFNKSEAKQEKLYGVSSKNRMIAMFLCMLGLIGFAGLHRMYVGKWWSGILYAGTFGFLGFGTLYDFYILYNEKFHDCDDYPIFAESSMKKNYRKRDPKKKNVNLEIVIACVLLAMINSSFNPIFMESQQSKLERQQAAQEKIAKEQQQKDEKRQQAEEKKQQKIQAEKVLSEKRHKFNAMMKKNSVYENDGLAGYELQIIVNEKWNSLRYEDKQNFINMSLNALKECELIGKVQSISIRFNLDGKKLATFDPSNGIRINH